MCLMFFFFLLFYIVLFYVYFTHTIYNFFIFFSSQWFTVTYSSQLALGFLQLTKSKVLNCYSGLLHIEECIEKAKAKLSD